MRPSITIHPSLSLTLLGVVAVLQSISYVTAEAEQTTDIYMYMTAYIEQMIFSLNSIGKCVCVCVCVRAYMHQGSNR